MLRGRIALSFMRIGNTGYDTTRLACITLEYYRGEVYMLRRTDRLNFPPSSLDE